MRSLFRRLRVYALETKYELLKQLRLPAYVVPTLAFPAVFYVLFAVTFGGGRAAGGVSVAAYMIATYGAFGVIGASLFAFGIGIATERGQGWMLLKRATPMPPEAYLIAKLAVALVFAVLIVGLLTVLGVTVGHVRLPLTTWIPLAAILVAGAVPFCAFGLAIGFFAGPNSAAPTVNLIYLPLAFGSGLWIPIELLPRAVRSVAPFLPPYHYGQLALSVLGAARTGSTLGHVLVLTGFAGLCLVFAYLGYLRDDGRAYG
ncbi:MAG: ABC transporter permease [Betaproteobacteria bacterium]